MVEFNLKNRPGSKEDNDKKENTFDSVNAFYEGWELTLNDFRSGLKILSTKEMLRILPITL